MNLIRITAPTEEPVTLSELKTQLRIDPACFVEDDLLLELIASAREHAEDITGRAILTQAWEAYLDGWPCSDSITLPFGNLQDVELVAWKDCDGASTALTAGEDYIVETNGEQKGRVVLNPGKSWPGGSLHSSNPITIRFTCGWETASDVPERYKQLIKMLCADAYRNRGEKLPATLVENTFVDRLMTPLRLW